MLQSVNLGKLATYFLIVITLFERYEVDGAESSKTSDIINEIIHKLFSNYDKSVIPKKIEGPPVTVDVQLYVYNLGGVNLNAMEVSMDLFLTQRWIDYRLVTKDSPVRRLSIPSKLNSLWVPDLDFRAQKRVKHQEPFGMVWLNRSGGITYRQKMSLAIACHLDLWQFPMDTQKCNVEIGSFGQSNEDVVFKWFSANSVRLHKTILSEYESPRVQLSQCTQDDTVSANFSCIATQFSFHRRIGFYVIYVYLPTTLIVMLSWLSFWIDYECTPARISIVLLSVLALLTQGNVTIQKLPRVSYVKALDIWLFTCLAFVVISMLEFATVNVISRRGSESVEDRDIRIAKSIKTELSKTTHENISDKIDQVMRSCTSVAPYGRRVAKMVEITFILVYPIMFVVFLITYWCVYKR